MVLVSKQDRRNIYNYLLKEGTLVVKKDTAKPLHDEIKVSNLKVMMVCKSLKSKGLLEEKFNWQYYYYYLNSEGISAMCDYLGLPSNIKPDIYKAPAKKREAEGARGFGRKRE